MLLNYLREIFLQLILCSLEIHVLKNLKLKMDQNNQFISIENSKIRSKNLFNYRNITNKTCKIKINKFNVKKT